LCHAVVKRAFGWFFTFLVLLIFKRLKEEAKPSPLLPAGTVKLDSDEGGRLEVGHFEKF